MELEEGSVGLEELSQKTLDPMPVDVGDWVEKLEIDVYKLLGWKSKNRQRMGLQYLPSRYPLPLVFFSTSFTGPTFNSSARTEPTRN